MLYSRKTWFASFILTAFTFIIISFKKDDNLNFYSYSPIIKISDTLTTVKIVISPSFGNVDILFTSKLNSTNDKKYNAFGFLISEDADISLKHNIKNLTSHFVSSIEIFSSSINNALSNGLDSNKLYYIRSYAIKNSKVLYSKIRTFQINKFPRFTLKPYTFLSPKGSSMLIELIGDSVSERGVCYYENAIPSLNIISKDKGAIAQTKFIGTINTLKSSTFYHARGYCWVNGMDLVYSQEDAMFRTLKTGSPNYKLNWTDEFNGYGDIDTSKWGYETGLVRNEELQWYQKDNAYQRDGNLIIEGRQETRNNPNFIAGSSSWKTNRPYIHYTSSSINTSGKKSWTYGHFEIKAKIPVGAGLWPAIWTLGYQADWPSNGEIDILEYYGNAIHANFAVGSSVPWVANWYSQARNISTFGGNSWANDYHLWSMDWDSDSITLYVDNRVMNSQSQRKLMNAQLPNVQPFQHEQYLLLNLALGGIGGGVIDSSIKFPQKYYVDYVRIFQK